MVKWKTADVSDVFYLFLFPQVPEFRVSYDIVTDKLDALYQRLKPKVQLHKNGISLRYAPSFCLDFVSAVVTYTTW